MHLIPLSAGDAIEEGKYDLAALRVRETRAAAYKLRTHITAERAAEMVRTRGFDGIGATPDEHQELRRLWRDLPGHTCLMDIVRLIERGAIRPHSVEDMTP